MANVLKALTQRFQRQQLNDYPNQVKVSDRDCLFFNPLTLHYGRNILTNLLFTIKTCARLTQFKARNFLIV